MSSVATRVDVVGGPRRHAEMRSITRRPRVIVCLADRSVDRVKIEVSLAENISTNTLSPEGPRSINLVLLVVVVVVAVVVVLPTELQPDCLRGLCTTLRCFSSYIRQTDRQTTDSFAIALAKRNVVTFWQKKTIIHSFIHSFIHS